MPDFVLDSLRGGYDDSTPVGSLPKDSARVAENVEFWLSSLGERRAGSTTFALPAGITAGASRIVWAYGWFPDESNAALAELWVLAFTNAGAAYNTPVMYRRTLAGWFAVAFPSANDEPKAPTRREGYEIAACSLHGKLFLSWKKDASVDRLLVWDGTSLRRVGLAAQSAPTAANTGVGAYAAVLRYYRTRMVKRSGGVVQVRSEPSPSVSFTPSGAGTAARVTRAALVGESETDWEVEASLDNGVFYKIATVAAATTTYDDSAATTTYANNPQSDPLLSYTLLTNAKYLSTDEDRLILGGNHALGSIASVNNTQVRWTPVGNDPLPGPDERTNGNTNPTLNLDSEVTGLSNVSGSSLHGFSYTHTYRIARTGNLVGSFEALCVTKRRGALPRSIVEGFDESGRSAVYFVDPFEGPMRAGAQGLQYLAGPIRNLFRRINRAALQPCTALFYQGKLQMHWWIALDTAITPNCEVILQTNLIETDQAGDGRKGWSINPSTCRRAYALSATMFVADIDSFGSTGVDTRVPFLVGAFDNSATPPTELGQTSADMLQKTETGTTDNGTAYTAKVRSKPFFLANILNRFGSNAGALLGLAGSRVLVKLIRDFGLETISVAANMTAAASETHVVAELDNLNIAELYSLEVEFTDDPNHITQWQLFQFALKESNEQTS